MDNYHTLDVAPVVLRGIQCAAATATCGGKFEALVKCLDRHQSLQLSSGFPSAKRLDNWVVNTKLVLSTTAFEGDKRWTTPFRVSNWYRKSEGHCDLIRLLYDFDRVFGHGSQRSMTAECNILERFVLRQCGAVAACESRLLRAAVNGSLRGDAPLGSMTSY
jgi:hypothetical protein